MTAQNGGRGYRTIVDTHRHPVGPKLRVKMAEVGAFDPNQELPQTNAQDLIVYRDFVDLDYAMPKQREGGVTLNLASNRGERREALVPTQTVVGPPSCFPPTEVPGPQDDRPTPIHVRVTACRMEYASSGS